MSKAAAIATTAIGGSSGVLGVAYLAGAFSTVDYVLPHKFEDFTSESNGIEGCVLSTFPGIKIEGIKDKGTDLSSASDGAVTTSFLTSTDNKDKVTGCLVVNWDKEKATNQDKWKGTFRFLWSVKEGKNGFVVFAVAKNGTEEADKKKLVWNGTVYQLEKKNTGWESAKKLNTKTDAKYGKDNDDLKNSFPKVGDDESFKDIKSKDFWGFLKDANEAEKSCDSDCEGELSKSSFRGYWTLEGDSTTSADKSPKKLEDWTSSLSTWWGKLFDDSKWKMSEVVKDKNVKWNKVFLEQPKQEASS